VREVGDEPVLHRIADVGHDDRNRPRGLLGSLSRGRGSRHEDVDLEPDELGGERREAIGPALSPALLEGNVLTYDVTQSAQPLPKRSGVRRGDAGRIRPQDTDTGNLSPLLPLYRKRRKKVDTKDDREPDPPQRAPRGMDGWRGV